MTRMKAIAIGIVLAAMVLGAFVVNRNGSRARKSAEAVDIGGTWDFVVKWTTGYRGTPVFTLKQSGEKLTGTYEGGLGTRDLTGTIEGGAITLEFEAPNGQARITGTLEATGREMDGQFDFSTGSHGSFTAARR